MVAAVDGGTRPETRRAVYDYIHGQGMATKQDIASALSLSLPTVNKYVSYFLRSGFIEKKAKLASGENGGRHPVAYACVAGARFAVGVDINAARVSSLLISLDREVIHRRRTVRPFERSESYLRFLGKEVEQLVGGAELDRSAILGVGIAVPGLVDQSGKVFYGKVIDVLGMSAADIGRYIDFPCHLMHDSNAAGLAEFWGIGATTNAFYLGLGNSVGGSVLLRGEIFNGDGVFSGEIGHLQAHPGGRACYCGQRGCLDPYCNATVLANAGDGTVEGFFGLLDAGDLGAAAVWESYSDTLAGALHDIRTLFGCRIILGGDVGVHLVDRLAPLMAKVDALSFREDPSAGYLLTCRHRTDAIATGAALHFVDAFRHDPGSTPPRRRSGAYRSPRTP